MKCKVLQSDKEQAVFLIEDISPAIANTLRRYITNYVPTAAIEDVEFKENSSALSDEMLAHRLGLIPLKTDLKGFTAKVKEVKFTLSAKGPCVVYAEELKSNDPKMVPVFDKMPITKLMKSQEIKLSATAVLDSGKRHIKFSPGLLYYHGFPEFVAGKDANFQKITDIVPKDVLEKKGAKLEVKDVLKWNEAYEDVCEQNGVDVVHSDTSFVFYLESFGQLSPKEMLVKAVDVFDEKLDEFAKLVSKLK